MHTTPISTASSSRSASALARAARVRSGRLLIEALLALALASASLLALLSVQVSALTMSDSAAQLDLADQQAALVAARTLRGPCGAPSADATVQLTRRHASTVRTQEGAVRTAVVADAWQRLGLVRRDSVATRAEIGVRCD